MKNSRLLFCLVFVITFLMLFCFTTPAFTAAIPQYINYQGFLTDRNGVPRNGVFPISFAFYDGEDADPTLWTGSPQDVYVKRGVFSVLIGPITNPDYVFGEHDDVWMGITVGTDSEMRPLSRVTTVGYAFNADRVQGQAPSDNIFPSSGNVGIGPNAPDTKLHIEGNLKVTAAIEGDASPVKVEGGLNVLTGNVGIGTLSPVATLEVVGGSIKATGGLIVETRTSDPTTPATGQVWLRTDI